MSIHENSPALDGKAGGGLLRELFAVDVTAEGQQDTVRSTCNEKYRHRRIARIRFKLSAIVAGHHRRRRA